MRQLTDENRISLRRAREPCAHGLPTPATSSCTWRTASRRSAVWTEAPTCSIGPRIYQRNARWVRIVSAGMVIDGRDRVYDETAVATTPAEGRRIVAEQADMGFRFVKVYNALAPDVYAAIVAEAGRRGMPVVGHIPDAVSIEAAVRAGQRSVEHFNGFAPVIAAESAAEMAFLAVPVDSAAVERLADLLADLGVFVVPTFTAFARAAPVERAREMFDRPEHAYMHPQLTEGWAVELLRRFLLHRLPRGFHHIRHYGLLGNRHRERQIACCRELLG